MGFLMVFGSVVEGMDFVRKIERVGSQSGKTSRPVTIIDCGTVGEDACAPPARPSGMLESFLF